MPAIHSAELVPNNEQNNSMDSTGANAFTEPLSGYLREFDFDLDGFFDSQYV